MQHRNHMPQKERYARSKLAKLLHDYPLIKGALVTSGRTCGKPGCKCAKGEKHISSYLSVVRHKGKREMICVPKQLEHSIRTSVQTYKDIMELVDIISDFCLDRLMKSKKTRKFD